MPDDWQDVFRSWSYPDRFAHPDSPAGGSGPGFSRVPRYSGSSWPRLPHPDSPAGRHLHWDSELRRKQIVADLSDAEKLRLAVGRALFKLPREVREKVRAMLTPEALATMGAIAAVWCGSHWVGVGEVVDVVMLGWGVWTLGTEALNVAKDLYQFITTAARAQNDEDIDQAADHFAGAIAVIGIDGLAAILAHKAFRTLEGGGEAPNPFSDLTDAETEGALRNIRAEGDLLKLQPDRAATRNREALRVTGKDVQSAHGAPQSVMKHVPGYNPKDALTRLMFKAEHTGMDKYWKESFVAMQKAGVTRVTAQQAYDIVAESIRRTPGMAQGTKNSLVARLSDEMFVEYGLKPHTLLDLPYRNFAPK
jgi:hypothetical protein